METLHVQSTESERTRLARRQRSAVLRALFVVAGASLAVVAGSAPASAAQGFLNCASNGYRYNYCSADTQGRVVMLREVSTGNLCRQGRGWGYDNGGIWVDQGCRAEFSYGRDNDNWSGGGNWNGPGTLTCESISYRYRRCDADTQNRVNLMRELSTGNLCRQGYGWGYDSRAIWVDRGCRGEFSYGRDSDGGNRHNDAAIAAGIIGALAIGAAIGSSQAAAPPSRRRRRRHPRPSSRRRARRRGRSAPTMRTIPTRATSRNSSSMAAAACICATRTAMS